MSYFFPERSLKCHPSLMSVLGSGAVSAYEWDSLFSQFTRKMESVPLLKSLFCYQLLVTLPWSTSSVWPEQPTSLSPDEKFHRQMVNQEKPLHRVLRSKWGWEGKSILSFSLCSEGPATVRFTQRQHGRKDTGWLQCKLQSLHKETIPTQILLPSMHLETGPFRDGSHQLADQTLALQGLKSLPKSDSLPSEASLLLHPRQALPSATLFSSSL